VAGKAASSEQPGDVARAGKTDLLRERYEQFSQGDLERALSTWSEDFTWEGGNSEDMPGGGTHEGNYAAVAVLQQAVGRGTSSRSSPTSFFEPATRGRARTRGSPEGD
jgi:ketosteroid isomerase-like protein